MDGTVIANETNPRGAAVFDASQFTLPRWGKWAMRVAGSFRAPAWKLSMHAFAQPSWRGMIAHWNFASKAFNVLNHAEFFGASSVEGNISSASFGQAVSAMPPRLMQVALRYRF